MVPRLLEVFFPELGFVSVDQLVDGSVLVWKGWVRWV